MRKLLLALWALAFASQAIAQSFPKPPDVPAFNQKVPQFKTDGTANGLLDSTVTPLTVTPLTNIAVPNLSGREVTTADQTESHITGSISGTTLTMTGLTSGPAPRNGDLLYGTGISPQQGGNGLTITAVVSAWNGTSGTYTINKTASISSEAIVSTPVNFCLTLPFGGPCGENKFRTLVDFSHMAPDDPIRNYGQPASSHLHCFFGNGSTNAYSTFSSLRHHALNSTAAGTDVNGTGYWHPCIVVLNPYGDGKNYAIRPNFYTVYYTENAATDGTGTGAKAPLQPGTRYVFSFDMDAVWNATTGQPDQYSWLQSIINTANATQGSGSWGSTRYQLTQPSNGFRSSQVHYTCVGATPGSVQVLMNADGSDPFNGTCDYAQFTGYVSGTTLTVTAMTHGTIQTGMDLNGPNVLNGQYTTIGSQISGTTGGVGTYNVSNSQTVASSGSPQTLYASQEFTIQVSSTSCYDGQNLWSPGGYQVIIPSVWDNLTGTFICPYNYYRVPSFTLEIHLTQYGWSDRQRWDLSSDIAYRSKYGLTKAQLPPGTTFHTDWMFGWDNVEMLKWETNCLGVEHHTGHQCDSSQIDKITYLKGGYAGEGGITRAPQVNSLAEYHMNQGDPGWMLIPSNWSASLTNMHMHQ